MRIITATRREGRIFYLERILLPLVAASALTLFIGLFYGLFVGKRRTIQSLDISCDANGDVHVDFPGLQFTGVVSKQLWNPSFFLAITMGFGHFSFATARILDGLWDILVGRCGQAGLALLAYPVLRRSLNVEMERHAASLPLFASLAFEKFSATAAWNVLLDAFTAQRPARGERKEAAPVGATRSRQVWRYLAWASILIYWLAFPTITSITTGYQPRYEPYLSPPGSDSLIPMAPFTAPPVIMGPSSGAKIGYPETVALSPSSNDPSLQTLWQYYETCFLPTISFFYRSDALNAWYPRVKSCPDGMCNCTLTFNEATPDFFFLNTTSSNLTLGARTWSPDGGLSFERQCASSEIHGNCLDSGNVVLTDGNYTLTRDFMQSNGFCRPLNKYKWGFSSLALLTHLLITLLVASVLMALHFDAFRKGSSDRHILDNNLYSDAVIVSRELERLPFDRPLEEVTASELEDVVRAKGASIRIEGDDLERPRGMFVPTWSRRRKDTSHSEHEAKEDLL